MIADWLIIVFVVAVLWGFWLWLGAIFDAISNYHHSYTSAAKSREDSSPNKEKERS